MEEERDIQAFKERIEDRFGKIPTEGMELIRIVRFRRMAKGLGVEKAILKKGQMILYMVSNPKSLYYESDSFSQVLAYIQRHPKDCKLREQNDKLSIVVKNVTTVGKACAIMEEIEKIN